MRNYEQMRAFIEANKGKFIRVDFIKKDGTERRMIVQPAKLKFEVKGDEASEEAKRRTVVRKENNPNLMAVWDVQAEGIRSINFDTVTSIKAGGAEYNYG